MDTIYWSNSIDTNILIIYRAVSTRVVSWMSRVSVKEQQARLQRIIHYESTPLTEGPRWCVRYPTCLRTEFDSKANTIGAQHPNSDTRIKIADGFTNNLTISSPYEPKPSRPTGFPFLSIFFPYSRRDPRWFPGYDLLLWPFSDFPTHFIKRTIFLLYLSFADPFHLYPLIFYTPEY